MTRTVAVKTLPVVAAALIALAILSSCTTKKYYEDNHYYDYGLAIDPIYFYPEKSDFRWDDELGRWYYTERNKYLDLYQLEEMEMAGTVIFGTGDDSYFCPLPYVVSYYYEYRDGTTVPVIENIGYEATYGEVTFFIQTNERDITHDFMLDELEFKLSLFYWIE
ncbi:MAG: hypothetical protein LUD76_09840 [Alistipes sp.]|nr:hypothetical protein [Alistipes sp.]